MRSFKHFNSVGKSVCPICKTADDKETVLIGVVGTEEGHNMIAKQFHLDCIDLLYYPNEQVIAQRLT